MAHNPGIYGCMIWKRPHRVPITPRLVCQSNLQPHFVLAAKVLLTRQCGPENDIFAGWNVTPALV
jgi:hypothetical protein